MNIKESSIDKQTKNRNETDSNMSLVSKRLGRKRCCDATPDRCLEVCRLTIFASHCKKMLRLLPKIEGFDGIPGPEAYQIKNEYAQRQRLRRITSLPKVKFSRLERLYQTPKKWKLAFQKCKLSNSFFKMQLQNCVFPNFNLQIILSSKSNFRSSFASLFNFKFSKTCWKEAWLISLDPTYQTSKAGIR